jgi:tRNA A37 threonylcarbamoyladenosine biosynthesis protein TsaE
VLVLLEWGERFPELLPEQRVEITLSHKGEQTRSVQVRGLSR